MGRALTNYHSLSYALQSAFNNFTTAAGQWKLTEPNEVPNFGATITTVARQPISRDRQAREGTATDHDADVEVTCDLTRDSFIDFAEGFAFTLATGFMLLSGGGSGQNLGADNALTTAGTPPGFTHSALAAAIPTNTLLYSRAFLNAINNGLNVVIAGGSTTETPVGGAPAFVLEVPSAATNASLEKAGWRFTDLTWTNATNTIGSALQDMTLIGLTVGQLVHVGGLVAGTQFTNGVAYARVRTISAASVVLDNVSGALKTAAADQAADAVDLLFGQFIRNVPVDNASFRERIFLFEGSWPNLFETDPPTPVANPDGFEYINNCYCNQASYDIPLSDKATVTYSFVGTFARDIVDNSGRQTGASAPRNPVQTAAYNTSRDVVRLRIKDVDETGLTTDFKSFRFIVNNNVGREKVIGVVGARYINVGNLAVTIEGNILFTSPLVVARIRNNTRVAMDFILKNTDGVIGVDIPSMTLGNGARELPVNETVQVALSGTAFRDATLGTSMGLSLIPVVPT